MQTFMIIPTYWSEPDGEWNEGDSVYDHATPINEEGTLARTLKSIEILDDKNFTLIILGAVTNLKYLDLMEEKLTKIILEAKLQINTILFTDTNLQKAKKVLYEGTLIPDILHLNGYSNIRNICLFLPYILDADIALLIDDDEFFEDPKYVNKAKEFIGRKFGCVCSIM
ncbi:MAG: hypothetical protein K8S23_01210 [Candidatus Cloacimonetes bacterium]|nr:hypothetical protein [Candidatus Cloacimonadota bacterium]